ncbi:hypothetical protein V490_08696 [Pseudogymnoascus sp. VKM F-3557]|nr:hypothetical protein V490_08696 [Pseudogymnoascus sp. VKM F-3557]
MPACAALTRSRAIPILGNAPHGTAIGGQVPAGLPCLRRRGHRAECLTKCYEFFAGFGGFRSSSTNSSATFGCALLGRSSATSATEQMTNQGRGGYNRGPDDDDEPEDGRGGYN